LELQDHRRIFVPIVNVVDVVRVPTLHDQTFMNREVLMRYRENARYHENLEVWAEIRWDGESPRLKDYFRVALDEIQPGWEIPLRSMLSFGGRSVQFVLPDTSAFDFFASQMGSGNFRGAHLILGGLSTPAEGTRLTLMGREAWLVRPTESDIAGLIREAQMRRRDQLRINPGRAQPSLTVTLFTGEGDFFIAFPHPVSEPSRAWEFLEREMRPSFEEPALFESHLLGRQLGPEASMCAMLLSHIARGVYESGEDEWATVYSWTISGFHHAPLNCVQHLAMLRGLMLREMDFLKRARAFDFSVTSYYRALYPGSGVPTDFRGGVWMRKAYLIPSVREDPEARELTPELFDGIWSRWFESIRQLFLEAILMVCAQQANITSTFAPLTQWLEEDGWISAGQVASLDKAVFDQNPHESDVIGSARNYARQMAPSTVATVELCYHLAVSWNALLLEGH
jgi:hypothetical protein